MCFFTLATQYKQIRSFLVPQCIGADHDHGSFLQKIGNIFQQRPLNRGHFFRENWYLPNGLKWADVKKFLDKIVWNPISMGVSFMKKIEILSNWGHRVWAVSAKWVPAKQPKKVRQKKNII